MCALLPFSNSGKYYAELLLVKSFLNVNDFPGQKKSAIFLRVVNNYIVN